MQSNVYDDETDFDVSGFIKHKKSRNLENETFFKLAVN